MIINLVLAIVTIKLYYKLQSARVSKTTNSQPKITDKEIKASLYRLLPVKAGSTVIIGDSHTDFFPLSLLNKPVVKEGIAGDTTEGVLQRVEKVSECNPAKVFIEIGHNDLSRDKSPKEVANHIIQIAEKFTCSKVYITSIFPSSTKSKHGKSMLEKDEQLNKILKQYCLNNNHTFIDLYSLFLQSNRLNPLYDCGDHVHLSYNGYVVWANQLNNLL
ncbi:hypothetical protein HH214_04375 [Mucilaginibacter robiniae]|uniref:SGNH hydrolase-type esterase domain-containing protein n=1 Tax=Mucilaginibacter robiniae TaxID=2728022 RepID=A0A7L5DYP5_9SPHI|nr:GDSL-type esterase/lipase family protein [Mucilaginibacter robiniae]QJD95169.1 hypothetical protein HH214_04375 [Mucilaginibacter robiniae]